MNKFFSLLGLCKRAGKLVAGEVAAEQAVRKKQAFLLILAQDASKNTKKKFTNSAVYYELPLAEIGTKEELGRAIGAEMRSIIALSLLAFVSVFVASAFVSVVLFLRRSVAVLSAVIFLFLPVLLR